MPLRRSNSRIGRFLLLGRHDAIFGNSCQTRHRDTDEAKKNSKKNTRPEEVRQPGSLN